MGIEKLTAEERNILLDLAGTWANRPLRIIDELIREREEARESAVNNSRCLEQSIQREEATALEVTRLAAAEQKYQAEYCSSVIQYERAEKLESECAALRAEVERLRADNLLHCGAEDQWRIRCRDAESRLAAATELLWEMRHAIPQDRRPGSLFRRSGAFLAAQPAAPPTHIGVDCSDDAPKELREFARRTEAEQSVLDACAALSTDSLEAFGKPASTPWVKFAHAELARRHQAHYFRLNPNASAVYEECANDIELIVGTEAALLAAQPAAPHVTCGDRECDGPHTGQPAAPAIERTVLVHDDGSLKRVIEEPAAPARGCVHFDRMRGMVCDECKPAAPARAEAEQADNASLVRMWKAATVAHCKAHAGRIEAEASLAAARELLADGPYEGEYIEVVLRQAAELARREASK